MVWSVKRRQLLASAAFLPLAWAGPVRAQTICSQAADGTVECVENGTVVATGTITPGTVQNGPGLVATADGGVDAIVGSVAGAINTDVNGETAVSLLARRDVDVSVGDVTSNGNGVFASSIDAGVALVAGDVTSSNGRGIFVSGHDLSVTCGKIQGAGENGTGLFLLGSGDMSIDCEDVETLG